MSDAARSFVAYLTDLKERDRGALARLRRSLASDPGTDPQVYPYVENFVGQERPDWDSWRLALYLCAGFFAMNPNHREGSSLGTAYGRAARSRESESLEARFMALLGAEPERLPVLLRQIVSILASDSEALDYVRLLDDLAQWLNPWNHEARDRLRQRWARDFYQAYDRDAKRTTSQETTNPPISSLQ